MMKCSEEARELCEMARFCGAPAEYMEGSECDKFNGHVAKMGGRKPTQITNAAELSRVAETVCDELCRYNDTADDDGVCDYMRQHGGECPLDVIS